MHNFILMFISKRVTLTNIALAYVKPVKKYIQHGRVCIIGCTEGECAYCS